MKRARELGWDVDAGVWPDVQEEIARSFGWRPD
jgi:hypothetical protein